MQLCKRNERVTDSKYRYHWHYNAWEISVVHFYNYIAFSGGWPSANVWLTPEDLLRNHSWSANAIYQRIRRSERPWSAPNQNVSHIENKKQLYLQNNTRSCIIWSCTNGPRLTPAASNLVGTRGIGWKTTTGIRVYIGNHCPNCFSGNNLR